MKLRLAIASTLIFAACEAEESGVALLPPDDVELHWDAAFNAEDDGLVGVINIDVMVYEGLTGAPLEGVAVLLDADHAQLLRPGAVLPADERCAADESSDVCRNVVWDAWQDQYVAIEAAGNGPVQLWTDADGIGRATVYVDAFPEHEDQFDVVDIRVEVAGGDARDVFSLVPQ